MFICFLLSLSLKKEFLILDWFLNHFLSISFDFQLLAQWFKLQIDQLQGRVLQELKQHHKVKLIFLYQQ